MIRPSGALAPTHVLTDTRASQPNEHDNSKDWLKYAWRQVASRTIVPKISMIHGYEMTQALNGERTLLPADTNLFERAKVICGLATSKNPKWSYLALEQHRNATAIRQRLDLLLATRGAPPLLQPRPKCQFTFFWAVYAALCVDPNNLTQWCDDFVDLDGLASDSFLYHVWMLKSKAFEALEQLGFSYNGRMEKNAKKILHLSQDRIKYRTFNVKAGDKSYDPAITSCNKKIKLKINALMGEAEIIYFAKGDYSFTRLQWRERFIIAAQVAFA